MPFNTNQATSEMSVCILQDANPQGESGFKTQKAGAKDLMHTGIADNSLTVSPWAHRRV